MRLVVTHNYGIKRSLSIKLKGTLENRQRHWKNVTIFASKPMVLQLWYMQSKDNFLRHIP